MVVRGIGCGGGQSGNRAGKECGEGEVFFVTDGDRLSGCREGREDGGGDGSKVRGGLPEVVLVVFEAVL